MKHLRTIAGVTLVILGSIATAPAQSQPGGPRLPTGHNDYGAIKTWHEQFLASGPNRRARVMALRQIVATGRLGSDGLHRIFNNFEGRMSVDPSIPGLERTARLLASPNPSQVKGHTQELLYAIALHHDHRNQLVAMGRPMHRPWGRTDADILLRNHRTGLHGRIEIKDYSLKSQRRNHDRLTVQMDKMAREAQVTGQPQFWINRRSMSPALMAYAKRSGIQAFDNVATGRRAVTPFAHTLDQMDRHFLHRARIRALGGSTMTLSGAMIAADSLPRAWGSLTHIVASDDPSAQAWLQLGRDLSYTTGGTGVMVSGTMLLASPMQNELMQGRLYRLGRLGGAASLVPLGAGVAIDAVRHYRGELDLHQLWRSSLHMAQVAAGAAVGGWVGGSIATIFTANPAGTTAGSLSGGVIGGMVADSLGSDPGDHVRAAALDEAFGNALREHYGLMSAGRAP